jgi:hypothetical protein
MPQYEEKYRMNTGLLQRGLRGRPPDIWKERSPSPPGVSIQALQQ